MTAYFCVFKFLASFLEADKTFFELVIFPNSSVLRSKKNIDRMRASVHVDETQNEKVSSLCLTINIFCM